MLTKKRTTSLQSDLAVYRARVADLERREENLKYEEQQRKQRELDLQRLREQKRKEEEKEAKTKRFFEVNRFNRRIAAPNEPVFFGDFESKYVAWRPHGQGEFSMNGAPILKGTFTHGDYVFGEITWENGQVWRGRVRNNCMQGPGTLTNGSDCAHVIMRDNVVVCKLEDLRPGTQLALFGGIPGQSCDRVDHTGRCLVNIVRHDHDWYFLCRFHEEVHPRERILNLASIADIEVYPHLPAIHSLFVQAEESPPDKPTYVQSPAFSSVSPASCRPQGMPARCLLPPSVQREGRRDNLFASADVGIGTKRL